MGESEEQYNQEELGEIDRILDLLPGDERPVPRAGAAQRDAVAPEAGFPADFAEVPPGEQIEDITDLVELEEEVGEARPSAEEAPEEMEPIEALEPVEGLEDIGEREGRPVFEEAPEEFPLIEEKLPEGPRPEEALAPAKAGEVSPLDELTELTSQEPESVDIQDISGEAYVGERRPVREPAEQPPEMPEFEEPPRGAAPRLSMEPVEDIEVPDLSDLAVSEHAEIPTADIDEIPEIGMGDIPAPSIPGERTPPPALDEEVSFPAVDEEIPSALELDRIETAEKKPDRKARKASAVEREEAAGIPDIEKFEDIVKTEAVPSAGIDEAEEMAEPPRRREKAPVDEGEIDLSSRELKKLKTALLLYPPALRRAVKETILNDVLPPPEARQLIDMILGGKPEDSVHRFLEKKLKRQIDITEEVSETRRRVLVSRPEYTREGVERQKHLFRVTRVVGAAALLAFLLTIAGYQFVYKPVMAKRYIRDGVALIRQPGDPVTAKVKDYAKAEELFRYVDRHYAKNYMPGYNAYGRAYFDKKEYELALRKLQKARTLDPANIETLNNLGYFYSKIPEDFYTRMKPPDAKATRLETAIHFYRMVLNMNPDNVTALYGIGNAYLYQGEHLKARQYYEDILRVDAESVVGYSGLLNLYIERDALPEVLSIHAQAVDRDILPEMPSPLLGKLAAYYLGKKRTDTTNIRVDYGIQSSKYKDLSDNPYPAVRAVLEALHKRDQNYPQLFVLHAKLSKELKNLNRMEYYLKEKALKEEPNYFAALHLLGEYYYLTKEPAKAYEYLNKAIRASASPPDFTGEDFYFETESVGRSFHLAGNIFYYFFDRVKYRFGDELAEEELDSSVEQLANYEMARQKYEQALRENYRDPELFYNLGRIYYLKGQYEQALEQWLELYEDFVNRPELMISLGNAFYHLDNLEASRGEFLKVVSVLEREAEKMKTVAPNRDDHVKVFQTLSSACNNLGAVYQRLNNEPRSTISYWKAIDFAKRIERENEFARVNMARAFKTRPEPIMPILDENIPFSIDIYSVEMR